MTGPPDHHTKEGAVMRCDKCGARAYVETILDTGQSLYWCGHHADEYREAMTPYVVTRLDQRELADA